MQFITFQNFHIQTWFSQFLWFFSLKCWFKGQMISRIHLILPNAYKLMCFDRNINGNRNVKFLECDKWSLHWYKNLTLHTLTLDFRKNVALCLSFLTFFSATMSLLKGACLFRYVVHKQRKVLGFFISLSASRYCIVASRSTSRLVTLHVTNGI